MLNDETILARVTSIVAINTGYEPEDVAADAHFEDDLGMMQPDFIRVIAKINKEFEMDLSAAKLYEEISTVEELVALVEDETLWG
jgi:acyl carrier protein